MSNTIQARCRNCATAWRVPVDSAGQAVTCVKCGRAVTPTADPDPSLSFQAGAVAPPRPARRRRPEPPPQQISGGFGFGFRLALGIAAAIVLIVGLPLAAVFAFGFFSVIDTSNHPPRLPPSDPATAKEVDFDTQGLSDPESGEQRAKRIADDTKAFGGIVGGAITNPEPPAKK